MYTSSGEPTGHRRRKWRDADIPQHGREVNHSTHRDPSRHQIHLVKHIYQMLMRLLLSQILHNRLTPRPHRVSRIQDMDDNIGRIEDFVQFTPDSSRGPFRVYRFTGCGGGGVIYLRWQRRVNGRVIVLRVYERSAYTGHISMVATYRQMRIVLLQKWKTPLVPRLCRYRA
jgi:hypothetical protein